MRTTTSTERSGEHCVVATPIGPLRLEANASGLTGVVLPRHLGEPARCTPARSALLRDATRQIEEYFAGTRRCFALPLVMAGTAFQNAVWRSLATIAWGETITYAELAAAIGRPAACRAVGQANGANPLPIVVPCHRVVAAGRRLGGYSGGLEVKRALLALEGVAAPA
jgi:methylated-DNA-[protein]-cysteine S-methyltransferase